MSNAEKQAVVDGQGSTFLWTEHYADRTPTARAVEILRDTVFGLSLVVLAAGVAGFLTLDRPTARTATTIVAHRAL